MRIYVESNFVLELTLMQEEHDQCKQILEICQQGEIQLVVPAYAFAEPNETLIRRDKARKKLADDIRPVLRELGRSIPYKSESDTFQPIVDLFTRSGSDEKRRLLQVWESLLNIGEIIPLGRDVLLSAPTYQSRHSFSPQDAIIFASILQHLMSNSTEVACFVTKNFKDFKDPDINDVLANYNCKLLFSFSDGLGYIQSQI